MFRGSNPPVSVAAAPATYGSTSQMPAVAPRSYAASPPPYPLPRALPLMALPHRIQLTGLLPERRRFQRYVGFASPLLSDLGASGGGFFGTDALHILNGDAAENFGTMDLTVLPRHFARLSQQHQYAVEYRRSSNEHPRRRRFSIPACRCDHFSLRWLWTQTRAISRLSGVFPSHH